LIRVSFYAGTLLMASAASAANWSMVPSTCVPVNQTSNELYMQDTAKVTFKPGKTGQVQVRCAVTNPLDPNIPLVWSTFAVGCKDPDGVSGLNYEAHVNLKRVAIGSGVAANLVTLDCNTGSKGFNHVFDFVKYAYYVTVSVTRKTTTQNPSVWAVQLK
jgi:hypothetical protein